MRLLLLFAGILLATSGFSQSNIQFQSAGWADILATAEREDKLIFMDAYTTWCGPCKRMAAEVFTDQAVAAYFNATFVNAKVDMEKGEGLELARRYEVNAYPTLLFINGAGEVVHRGLGYHNLIEFMELGRLAADDEQNLLGMSNKFDGGERSPEFLSDYAYLLRSIRDQRSGDVAMAYLETQEDWATDEHREFIMTFTQRAQGPLFEYIAQHRDDFETQFGKSNVVNFLQRLVIREISYGGSDQPALEEMEELLQRSFPDLADMLMARFRMTYYQRANDTENFIAAAIAYLEQFGSDDANELNNIAWYFYEEVDDAESLAKAVGWAEQSVELDTNYYNMDTLAALYYKTGDKEKARTTAEAAIELAKAQNQNYDGTQQLLEMIERM